MNRDWLLFHLKEARDELSRTVDEIERDPEFDEGQLRIALAHLYHHANTAWNSPSATKDEVEKQSDAEWDKWGAFPENFDLMKVGE
jgi:hypothetical protein